MATQDGPAEKRARIEQQQQPQQGISDAAAVAEQSLDRLPPELLIDCILTLLAPEDLCALLASSTKAKALLTDPAIDSLVWGCIARSLWDSPLLQDAVAVAGSYRAFALQKRRHLHQAAAEWKTPCEFEMQASLHRIATAAATTPSSSPKSSPRPSMDTPTKPSPSDSPLSARTTISTSCSSPPSSLAPNALTSSRRTSTSSSSSSSSSSDSEATQMVPTLEITPDSPGSSQGTSQGASESAPGAYILFLLDGSGSVGDEEFAASTSFIARAAADAKTRTGRPCKVAVMQFSNDVRTEWEDGSSAYADDISAFKATIQSMVRMNGGTNIAAALTHAGKVLKRDAGADVAKVIVLITDGRVDGYQAKEARHVAAMLSDEQPHTTMFAYGVGRGVDRTELLAIIGAATPSEGCAFRAPESRYLDLFHREEAPW